MTTYQYEIIDGQRVERNVAAQYRLWAAAFKKETGLDLFVSSGVRTAAEQEAGYERYLRGESGGVKWAKPTESSHCEIGPSGPRALDIRDSGKDAGVTVKGTARWNTAVRLGAAYGFTWGGWGVPDSEGWHFENHRVKVGVYSVVAAAVAAVKRVVTASPSAMLKWRWIGIQKMLKAEYGYRGRIDNIPGAGTIGAFQRFLNTKGYARRALGGGLAVDGKFGVNTCKAAQQWLRETRRYSGAVDGIPGAGTAAGWTRAEAENARAYARIR